MVYLPSTKTVAAAKDIFGTLPNDGEDTRRVIDKRSCDAQDWLQRRLKDLGPKPTVKDVIDSWFVGWLRMLYGESVLCGTSLGRQRSVHARMVHEYGNLDGAVFA
jgi:hypothetical protein